MIARICVDTIFFVCLWLVLFIWLAPIVSNNSSKANEIRRKIRFLSFLPYKNAEKIKELSGLLDERIHYLMIPTGIACAIITGAVIYVIDMLLWR